MQNDNQKNPPELPESQLTPMPLVEATNHAPQLDLRAAREAKHLSAGDAAYALKVSPRVIEALEAGNWAVLPGRTFTVGILRAYGRLLEISVDTLVDAVPGATPSVKRTVSQHSAPGRSAPTSRRDGEAKRQTNRMLKTGILMMLVAVMLAYVVPADFWQGTLQHVQSLYERVSGGQNASPAPEASPNAATPAATEQAIGTSGAVAKPQAQTGAGTLELRFAGPAWVEVRDYTGRIIYSQLNAAGSTQFITGAAPLDVMIGNAKQVQARWRDEPIKLDKLSGDDVARQVLQ